MYRAGTNKVLVRLDPDHKLHDGFTLPDTVHHMAVTGTVEDIGSVMNKSSRFVNEWTRSYYRQIPTLEVSEITPLEKGNRIIFSYISKLDMEMYLSHDLLLISRDLIIGKGTPFEGVNGYVLVRVEEKEAIEDHDGIVVVNDDVNNYGIGYVGEERIGFIRELASRLELDFHNTLTDGQSSLFKIKKEHTWQLQKVKSLES